MKKRKLMAMALSLSMVVTAIPMSAATPVFADDSQEPVEITLDKTTANPIGGYDTDGNLVYGGDPSILVDGDTIYLYEGHDTAVGEGYFMPEWICYSTKDLKNWTYHGVIMTADKESITWANTGTDAWAGQITKHKNPATGKDMYYFYYCTWDATSEGKQSIGVATSESPTGPFTDIGAPLVKGTVTTPETSGWNDIDPTVWVEEDEDGVEHRYLAWGNGKYYVCELNEDMISVKDQNGDGKITSGTSAASADIISQSPNGSFTEAPWLYRRSDENGKNYGPYYLFYAHSWREQMAYSTSTTEDLLNTKWTFGTDGTNGLLMEPTATSNTNHMAVFDFKGKTYFVYHNGSLPGGSGFRRSACITEIHFNEDGSIDYIPETAIGIDGFTNSLYTSKGTVVTHAAFNNSSLDSAYPYKDIELTVDTAIDGNKNAEYAIVAGKADPSNPAYVSIQSENKPGLYFTADESKNVVLAQDYDLKALEKTAKAQTFRTLKGFSDESGVTFESVAYPGMYITWDSGNLCLSDGTRKDAVTFFTSRPGVQLSAPADLKAALNDHEVTLTWSDVEGADGYHVYRKADDGEFELVETIEKNAFDSSNALKNLSVPGYEVTLVSDKNYEVTVPYTESSINVSIEMENDNGYALIDGKKIYNNGSPAFALGGADSVVKTITVYSADGQLKDTVTLTVHKDFSSLPSVDITDAVVSKFTFEDTTDGAVAVVKPSTTTPIEDAVYTYSDSISEAHGKAISLTGTYGLKLTDDTEALGDSYSISYWMKPTVLNGSVDPTLAGGTFDPEKWFNLTFGRAIWSKANDAYIDDAGLVSYEANKWQHVLFTVDNDKACLYINGKLSNTGTVASGLMTNPAASLYFGVNKWDAYFQGSVDDIILMNRVLTETEALALSLDYINAENTTYTQPSAVSLADASVSGASANSVVLPVLEEGVLYTFMVCAYKGSFDMVGECSSTAVGILGGIKLNRLELTLPAGSSQDLIVKAVPEICSTDVTWSSDNEKTATVVNGKVTAHRVGTATITATSTVNSAFTATCKITVVKGEDVKDDNETGNKPSTPDNNNNKPSTTTISVAAPSKISAANASNGIKVTWSKVSGATGYIVTCNGKELAKVTGSTKNSYVDKKTANGTKYVYSVCAYKTSGSTTVKSKSTKNVTIARVAAVKLSSLKSSAKKKLTVAWKKNAKATGYEIQYSTSKNFKSSKKVTIKKAKTVKTTLTKLKSGKKYYVRIRAYKTVGKTKYVSVWSSASNKKVK